MYLSISNMKYVIIVMGLMTYNSPVYAYLDPGTGSVLIQGLIGVFAATVSFLSIYWHKVKAFFKKKFIRRND